MEGYLDGLSGLLPEILLTGTALAALVLDLVMKGRNSRVVGWLTLAGLFATGFTLLGQGGQESRTVLGMVTIDRFGCFFKLFTVASLVVVVTFVLNDRRERRHGIGEYYFLLLGASIGAFFMVSTNNLLLMVLGLELLSLASYSLAGFHKGDKRSAEASMKYIIFGGLSSGIMVYGISLLYGLTGTLDMAAMGSGGALAAQLQASPTPVAVAVVLTLAGFAYKVSIAPFHFWTPDVYQGAPTPVTTFLAVASKAAGFAVLLRFLGAIFLQPGVRDAVASYGADVGALVAILAAVTMTLGNLSAMGQSSLKRLLAYSSIAHAGYALIGVACMDASGFTAAMYYLAAYYFMNLGAFGVLLYFEGVTGDDSIENLQGQGWRHPLVSILMVAFLVSLTGLPPTIGFYGKLRLFYAGLDGGLLWLVVVAGLNTVVSLFYYFRIAKTLFLSQPGEDRGVSPQTALAASLTVLAVLTVALGIWVAPLFDWARGSLDILG